MSYVSIQREGKKGSTRDLDLAPEAALFAPNAVGNARNIAEALLELVLEKVGVRVLEQQMLVKGGRAPVRRRHQRPQESLQQWSVSIRG